MKKIHMIVVAACAAVLALVSGAEARQLKVLTIGNSFSICLLKQLPKCAAATPGVTLDLCSLYIGGCSLERHWNNVEKAGDPSFRPYGLSWNYGSVAEQKEAAVAQALGGRKTANIPETLTADKWDIVTIQQASPLSWKADSYQPFADNLIAKIRALAPQAEIRVQQTWAYCNADGRIYKDGAAGSWGIDQKGMYDSLTAAYKQLAAKHGFKIIPTGLAVQLYRESLPVTFAPPAKDALAKLAAPEVPDMGGEAVGAYRWGKGGSWQKDKDEFKLRLDSIHLNREGEYLQACVWLAALFDTDVTRLAYAPDFGAAFAARAPVMRACAQRAVKEFK